MAMCEKAERDRAVGFLLFVLALSGLAGEPAGAGPAEILLRATGEAGTALAGRCTLAGPAGEKVVAIDAALPLERRFAVRALSCELQARGRVTVEVLHAGGRTRTSTDGGRMRIAVAAGGVRPR